MSLVLYGIVHAAGLGGSILTTGCCFVAVGLGVVPHLYKSSIFVMGCGAGVVACGVHVVGANAHA